MTFNHTPGPWAVDDVTSRGEHVYFRILSACQAPGIAGVYNDPCSAANARLIAAAPELLAALESAHDIAVADATMSAYVVAVMARAGYSVECIALTLAKVQS